MSHRWRFVSRACGQPPPAPGSYEPGQRGAFIRSSRSDREFPTSFVQRYPRNWGWVLNQCWGFSLSFPMPPKGEEPELEDDGDLVQSVTVETQSTEAGHFNAGLPMPDPDATSDDEEEGEGGAADNTTLVQVSRSRWTANSL